MIPGDIFTSFAGFQRSVSVNDFWLRIWLQELLQASLSFLWSFCLARIRLDPLGVQDLHHDCMSMIVSRLAIVTEDLVIGCNQITKFFSSRYGFAFASSTWGPCNFGPFTDLAISVFRKMSINTVLTQIWVLTLCLPKSSLLFVVGSKDTSWEELACESPCNGISSSTKFSLNSCSHSGILESPHGFPVLLGFPFYLFFLGFCWLRISSGRPDLSSTVVDTCTGEMSLSGWSSRSRVWISLTVGDEDELGEDVEQWLPSWKCARSWWVRSRGRTWQAWNHNRNEVLRVARNPKPGFLWDVVFDYWSIRRNNRFHGKAFRATILLVCFWGLSKSRIFPILWHTQLPLHAFALLHWRLWLP